MDQDVSAPLGTPAPGARASLGHDFPPPAIPDHQLLRCIGRGSYGMVWLARNMMGVYRAVKIVYRRSFESQRPFERELSGIQKFEPVSRSHEGFVDVLHVGINEPEGYFYYVMELGDDQVCEQNIVAEQYAPRTLAKEISRHGRLPLQACLQLGIALSQALAELHKRGLVHRDVKPSNIIFVHGIPKLADIGLVADVNEARSYVGTEGFIPPEGPGTAQADVYSLGKVLYEACTGKDRQEFPELPTHFDVQPDQPAFLELNEVVLRACKNDFKTRYQSAWDMHADLLVVANGKSVKRLRSLERRLANLKRTAGIAAIIVLIGSAVFYQIYRERERQLEKRQQQVGETLAFGIRALDSADHSVALANFAKTVAMEQGVEDREIMHRLRFGATSLQCPKVVQMWFCTNHLESVALSADGRLAVAADLLSYRAQVYDVQTSQPISPPLKHASFVWSVAFNPEGDLVVTASEDKRACVWRASDGSLLATLEHTNKVLTARFSPDGSEIVTGGLDTVARVWNWREQSVRLTLRFHTNSIMFATFSPDGQRIVTSGKDYLAQLWNANTGERIGPPLLHVNWVKHAAFSPDGRTLVTAVQDDKAHVWDISTPEARPIPPDLVHGDRVNSVAFSPDGRLLVTGCLDGTASVWLIDTHQLLKPVGILRHSGRVTHAVFDSDGRRVLTCCADGTMRLWDLADESQPPRGAGLFSLDGQRCFTPGTNGWQIRQTVSGKALSPPIRLEDGLVRTNFSRTGHFLWGISVVSSNAQGITGRFRVWDGADGQSVGPGIIVSNVSLNSALADDGKWLVTFSGKRAEKWDVRHGTKACDFSGHPHGINSGMINRDGRRLILWGGDAISVFDLATGKPAYPPLKHKFPIVQVALSPDERKLVVSQSGIIYTPSKASVWDAFNGKLLFELPHGDGVLSASFSPDGKKIATAGEDFKAAIWDAATGEQIAVLKHQNQVYTAVFSPDNRWVLTASADRTARIWSAETGHPLTPPLRHLRDLTAGRFLGDSRWIVTTDRLGLNSVWQLPVDARPLADLFRFTQVLSGEAVRSPGAPASLRAESLNTIWADLRARYPAEFAVTPWQIEIWHEFQGQQCYLDQQWSAADFHLHRVLASRRGDPLVEARLAIVHEHLREGQ